MSSDYRRRRSSFFKSEPLEKQLELFQNMNWVNAEKENIISNSALFGGRGREILLEFTEQFKDSKQEIPKLISDKQEEHILLKEHQKLRKSKIQIDWETACEGLSEFEKNFANNSPDFKCLAENIHTLTLHTALIKRANYELNAIYIAYNKRIKEKIKELQELLFNKVIEDSGVGISINNLNSSIISSSSSIDSYEEEILEF